MMTDTVLSNSPVKSEPSLRKNKKPLMEKRRRARINSCLSQLKSLVLQAIKKDSSQFSKLEKADILELTVKHLRALQRQQSAGVITQDVHVVSKYRAGFNECAKEVVRYMGSLRDMNEELKERLLDHLGSCMHVVNHVGPVEAMQQHVKPLHVRIPPHQLVGAAPAVLLPSSQTPQFQGGLGFPLSGRSSAGSSSPVAPRSSPLAPRSSFPFQNRTAMTTTASTVAPHNLDMAAAFKRVPSTGGNAPVYVPGSSLASLAADSRSVDTVASYSLTLPPQSLDTVPAFSTPTATSRMTTMLDTRSSPDTSRLADSSILSTASLPVDLRQSPKKPVVGSPVYPLPAECHVSLADDRLWRPW